MVKYIGEKDYQHGSQEKTGVLITNLGTPDAPTSKALKPYKLMYCKTKSICVFRHGWAIQECSTFTKQMEHKANLSILQKKCKGNAEQQLSISNENTKKFSEIQRNSRNSMKFKGFGNRKSLEIN